MTTRLAILGERRAGAAGVNDADGVQGGLLATFSLAVIADRCRRLTHDPAAIRTCLGPSARGSGSDDPALAGASMAQLRTRVQLVTRTTARVLARSPEKRLLVPRSLRSRLFALSMVTLSLNTLLPLRVSLMPRV